MRSTSIVDGTTAEVPGRAWWIVSVGGGDVEVASASLSWMVECVRSLLLTANDVEHEVGLRQCRC